jgi:glutamine cyclotransferase
MKYRILALTAIVAALFAACHNNPEVSTINISPDAGTRFKLGDEVSVKVSVPSSIKADSIVYLIDSVRITSRKDTLSAKLKTDSLKLGNRLITAKVYSGGKAQDASTNILLLAAKAPEALTFVIEKVFPHDTTCFTEGLQYQDGFFYESAGLEGESSVRKVDVNTGKVLQKVNLDPKYFGEGLSVVGDKILQLTYHDPIGFVYDKKTLKQIATFPYTWGKEGWGMCFDGKKLYMDDSTNRVWFMDKDNYREIGYIDVYDDTKGIDSINELEYIDGKLYANIWQTNTIIVIDPKNGAVLQTIDLTNLYPQAKRNLNSDVLNGIAWDAQGKRLFLTGKKWDKLFQVKFVKQ